MIHAPVPSVTADRVKPVSVCVAVTVTPGRTAPLSSVTRPASSAVAWAQATPVMRTRLNPTTRNCVDKVIAQSSRALTPTYMVSHPNAPHATPKRRRFARKDNRLNPSRILRASALAYNAPKPAGDRKRKIR